MAFDIQVPNVTFKTRREIDEAPGFEWYNLTSEEMFKDKRVVLFALPGAFTPTCSSTHLPGYEMEYDKLKELGIDEVYCLSVNDTFVMNSWMSAQEVSKVKPVPDGAGEFSRRLGFLVDKSNIGFGMRSWRYSMIINNGLVEVMFVEPGLTDNAEGDPFEVSDVYTMLEYLEGED
jgi:peroxiredoxin|tara:strand:- start:803 stop:1327 length:525 start_codon:yes stop_codon:yes gene_type:complete